MIIDILGYRDWARRIYDFVKLEFDKNPEIHFHNRLEDTCFNASMVFAVGWSEIIPEERYSKQLFLVLHPSPLPKYRGGSPIQHQLLNGEKVSAVSIFKLDELHKAVDSGPIAWQMAYSLEGSLRNIFDSIQDIGATGIITCINKFTNDPKDLVFLEQNEEIATVFKRRKPEESQIFLEEFNFWPAWKLHAKIRSLQDPYPNAFLECADGKKLYLTGSRLDD